MAFVQEVTESVICFSWREVQERILFICMTCRKEISRAGVVTHDLKIKAKFLVRILKKISKEESPTFK